jgi:acyl carrier protein
MIDQARNIIIDIFGSNLTESEIRNISIQTYEKWDSLSHVKIIMATEEFLSLSLKTEELLFLTSYNNINEIINRYRN